MDSIIITENVICTNDFEKLFEYITNDILIAFNKKANIDINFDQIFSKYLNVKTNKRFENLMKVMIFVYDKMLHSQKEKEIMSIILSEHENLTLKYQKENNLLKQDLRHLTSDYINLKKKLEDLNEDAKKLTEINKYNLIVFDNMKNEISLLKQGNFAFDSNHIKGKFVEIIKYCNEIQNGMNERKEFIENDDLIKFIESNHFQNNLVFGVFRIIGIRRDF